VAIGRMNKNKHANKSKNNNHRFDGYQKLRSHGQMLKMNNEINLRLVFPIESTFLCNYTLLQTK